MYLVETWQFCYTKWCFHKKKCCIDHENQWNYFRKNGGLTWFDHQNHQSSRFKCTFPVSRSDLAENSLGLKTSLAKADLAKELSSKPAGAWASTCTSKSENEILVDFWASTKSLCLCALIQFCLKKSGKHVRWSLWEQTNMIFWERILEGSEQLDEVGGLAVYQETCISSYCEHLWEPGFMVSGLICKLNWNHQK